MSYFHRECPPDCVVGRLVAEAQLHGAPSLEVLLRALRPALLRFFARRFSDDAAEDLTQEALIRVTRTLASIDAERADRLIMTIAVNLVRTALARRAKERRRTADADVVDLADTSPLAAIEGPLEYDELRRDIGRVSLTQLPPTLRQVVLGILQGDSHAEIAQRLGISPVTVRTRLFRARKVLRRALRGHLGSEPRDTGSSPRPWRGAYSGRSAQRSQRAYNAAADPEREGASRRR